MTTELETARALPAAQAPPPVRFGWAEWRRVALLLGVVAVLHVIGFGLFTYYNAQPRYRGIQDGSGTLLFAGAAALAYVLGLRHAFDADHIAAIDDTTRLLIQKGKRPLAVGLFFSLGHSTVVFALSVGIAFATRAAVRFRDSFEGLGGLIGTTVSGLFLYLVGALNLVILIGVWRAWRAAKRGRYELQELERLLSERGLMNRIFRGRYAGFLNHSWQMYPVGLLFGLGFDTATQVGLLALSTSAAAVQGGVTLPPLALISLPIIFAAGMSLMDTLDSVFMCRAYTWAFTHPLRKIYYNLTTTGLSVFVALVIGTLQLLSILAEKLGLTGEPWDTITGLDLNLAGYLIVGLFVACWAVSVGYWKLARLEERYGTSFPQ